MNTSHMLNVDCVYLEDGVKPTAYFEKATKQLLAHLSIQMLFPCKKFIKNISYH